MCVEEGRVKMSWYSDGERFNEHDDPYCIWKSKATNGRCGNSKAECDRCMEEYERLRYCDIYTCDDCPRCGDDCDGKEDEDDEGD